MKKEEDAPPDQDTPEERGSVPEDMKKLLSLRVISWSESKPLSCHTVISLKTVTVQFCMYLVSERVDIGNELID